MHKYTRTEGAPRVVSPEVHKAIKAELHKLNKTSARELSDEDRDRLRKVVDDSDSEC